MAESITVQLDRFRRRFWSPQEFEDWYGISRDFLITGDLFSDGVLRGSPRQRVGQPGENLDHWRFEIVLQRQKLLPINDAAAAWAVSVADFRRVVEALATQGQVAPEPGFFALGIVEESFQKDVVSSFDAMQRRVFGSVDSYIVTLHRCFAEVLGLDVSTLYDRTGEILREPQVAQKRDCLTSEPVGIARQIPLEFRKPMELAFDICSWVTYSRFAEELASFVISSPEHLSQEIQLQLRQANE